MGTADYENYAEVYRGRLDQLREEVAVEEARLVSAQKKILALKEKL